MTKTVLRSWKPALVFFSIILLAGGLGSQSPQASLNAPASSGYTIKWIRSFGNFFGLTPEMITAGYSEYSQCASAVETGDGGLAVVGTAVLFPPGGSSTQDLIVMEVRPSGDVDWGFAYECPPGVNTGYEGGGIARCQDGDYLVTGRSEHLNSNDPDFGFHPVLLKISPGGQLRSIKLFGAGHVGQSTFDQSWAPVPTSDGGFLIPGYTNDIGNWVLKLDRTGKVMWCKRYSQEVGGPHPTPDGGFVLTGRDSTNGIVVKCDPDGRVQWRRAYTQDPGWGCGDLENMIEDIVPTSDGGYFLIGNTSDCTCCHGEGKYNFWVSKLDSSGRIVWKKGSPSAGSILATRDGGFVLWDQYALIKYNGSGSFQWRRNVDSQSSLLDAFESSDGGFVATGSVFPPNAGNSVMEVFRLNSSGKIDNCERITSSFVGPSGTGIRAVSTASISVHSLSVWTKSLPVSTITRPCEVRTLCTSLSPRRIPTRTPTSRAPRP